MKGNGSVGPIGRREDPWRWPALPGHSVKAKSVQCIRRAPYRLNRALTLKVGGTVMVVKKASGQADCCHAEHNNPVGSCTDTTR